MIQRLLRISSLARLITPQEAAELLRVSNQTINNWISEDKVPYVELPGGRKRLPLGALIQSLSGNYDLLPDLELADKSTAEAQLPDVPTEIPDDE